jgi:dGTPase
MKKNIKYRLAAPAELCSRQNDEPYKSLPYRTEFERDRDRILYSKEFRRLSGKTQVFLSSSHDHVRNRLTHTLEVSQIARVTANYLGLDSDLAEAIALAHDVGHTPFGHVGERTLCHIMSNCDQFGDFQSHMKLEDFGFKHNLQSLRVVCVLEQLYGKSGLNLSNFTLWGIKHHTNDKWRECDLLNKQDNKCLLKREPKDCNSKSGLQLGFYTKYLKDIMQHESQNDAWSFEGQVVKESDEIAQRHHDIEDAIFMEIISNKELLEQIENIFVKFFDKEDRDLFEKLIKEKNDNRTFLPLISKLIVGLLNKHLIKQSEKKLNEFIKQYNISTKEDFAHTYKDIPVSSAQDLIGYHGSFKESEKEFHKFLKDRILNSFEVQRMDGKGRFIIRRLFKAYITNPRQLHDSTIHYVFRLYSGNEKTYKKLTTNKLGVMRNKVDSTTLKSDPRFMICLLRGICDHLAGMTDSFAISEYQKLYG